MRSTHGEEGEERHLVGPKEQIMCWEQHVGMRKGDRRVLGLCWRLGSPAGRVPTFLPAPRGSPLPEPGGQKEETVLQPWALCAGWCRQLPGSQQLRVGLRAGSRCVLFFAGGCQGLCPGSGA